MRRNEVLGAGAGVVGGILGSWMMVRFNHLVGRTEDHPHPEQHHRADAAPNKTDGTISDTPASVKIASAIGTAVADRPLREHEKQLGGSVLHYLFGAITGGFYGAVAERSPAAAAGFGLPFGATVWLAADEIGLPLAGLADNPATYPASRHAAALGTHLVFGATVEGVRRLLRGK
jgi:putative membrane protein